MVKSNKDSSRGLGPDIGQKLPWQLFSWFCRDERHLLTAEMLRQRGVSNIKVVQVSVVIIRNYASVHFRKKVIRGGGDTGMCGLRNSGPLPSSVKRWVNERSRCLHPSVLDYKEFKGTLFCNQRVLVYSFCLSVTLPGSTLRITASAPLNATTQTRLGSVPGFRGSRQTTRPAREWRPENGT